MSKTTKFLLSVLSLLLAISCIVAVKLPELINPNNYKANIAAAIKEKFDRDAVFGGDITLSVFPWLGLSVENITINNVPGFQELPFLAVKKAAISLKLLPLISKKIDIDAINIDGITVNLVKNLQGISNLDDLIAKESNLPLSHIGNAKQKDSKKKNEFTLSRLNIGSINILNTQINWNNKQTGKQLVLKNIQFKANKFVLSEPLKINLSMDVTSNIVKFPVSISCVTGLLVDEKLDTVALIDSQLTGFVSKALGNGHGIAASARIARTTASAENQSLQLSGLQFQSGEINFAADIVGKSLFDDPSLQGNVNIKPFNLMNSMKDWDLTFPSTNDSNAMTTFGMSFQFFATPDHAEFSIVDVVLDNSHGKGFVKIVDYTRPKLLFDLDVDSLDVGRYVEAESKSPRESSARVFPASSFTLPLDWLGKLDAEGNIRLEKLTFNQMDMNNLRLSLSSKIGVANIK